VHEHLAEIGERLRTRYHSLAVRAGVRSRLAGPPARMTFTFEPQGGRTPAELLALFAQEMLRRGVFTNGNILPSLAHDDVALERSAVALQGALDVLARASGARAARTGEAASPPLAATSIGFIETLTRDGGKIELGGWMLLEDGAADGVDVQLNDATCVRAEMIERRDVAAAYPNTKGALRSGYVLRLPTSSAGEVLLRAWRGDRVAFVCRVVVEGGALRAPVWTGDGIVFT
jgi:hypothetical protein